MQPQDDWLVMDSYHLQAGGRGGLGGPAGPCPKQTDNPVCNPNQALPSEGALAAPEKVWGEQDLMTVAWRDLRGRSEEGGEGSPDD